MKIELTDRQRDALLDVLNERMAGGTEDLRDSLGITRKEAATMMTMLERISKNLSGGQ